MDQLSALSWRQHCNPLKGGVHYSNGNPHETTAPGEWWDWVDYEQPWGSAKSLMASKCVHTDRNTLKETGNT